MKKGKNMKNKKGFKNLLAVSLKTIFSRFKNNDKSARDCLQETSLS